MRRAGIVVATVVVAVAGVIGLISFFYARDDAGIDSATATTEGPGVAAKPAADGRLSRGNVLITYRDKSDGPALRALAEDVAGPPDMSLVDAGQAVVIEQRPDQREEIVAHAYRRRLVTQEASDPELRGFVEFWLGQSAVE